MPSGGEGGDLIDAAGHGACGLQGFLLWDEAALSKGGCSLLPFAVGSLHQSRLESCKSSPSGLERGLPNCCEQLGAWRWPLL